MKLQHVFIAMSVLAFVACGGHKNCDHDHSLTAEHNFTITSGSAGYLQLGTKFADIVPEEGHTLTSMIVDAGEGMQETQWFVEENNNSLMGFFLETNSRGEEIIREIGVYSPLYKTDKNIGAGSSLNELKEAYPDLKMWYTYVGSWYVAETKSLPNVQFLIDPMAYVGDDNKIMQGFEQVFLDESDFNMKGKIMSVRIWTISEGLY